jgi:hypothetical protein
MADIFFPITFKLNPTTQRAEIFTDTPTRPLWGTEIGYTVKNFFTSSTETVTSKEYYYDVWASASLTCDDERLFSTTYGHISGSGSSYSTSDTSLTGDTPSRSIYNQFRLLCLDGDEAGIIFSGSTTPTRDLYALIINRDKFGDKLDPGNFQLNLAELNGGAYANIFYTGSNVTVSSSNKIISLVDDSMDIDNNLLEYGELVESPASVSIPRAIVSGTLAGVYDNGSDYLGGREIYGIAYPSLGVLLLSADLLNKSASFNTVTSSNANGDNSYKLFTSISGAASINSSNGFHARSIDVKKSTNYYISVMPTDYGIGSTNPSFVLPPNSVNPYDPTTTVTGLIKHTSMRWIGDVNTGTVGEPVVYITSIGLYNDAKELLAVAKLSEPLKHEKNDMLSITVKLEY